MTGGRLKVTAELPHHLKKLHVGSVPQPAPVEVGTQFPDSGHKLTGPHLGNDFL
jgi:hypothetical protein